MRRPRAWTGSKGTPLSEEDVKRHLIETVSPDRFGAARDPDDDFRIALAGAQEKTALLWWEGKWQIPHGSTPTTHIFKLPMGLVGGSNADFTTSVDNEWLCLRLLKAYGLDVAEANIETFGQQRTLVVERFDRRVAPDGQSLLRLPHEDFCQVEGVSPLRKYENEGGPGLKALVATLKQSVNDEADAHTLLASRVLFWLLRAPDGHAKNFIIQILSRGRLRVTRLYNVVSAYSVLGDGPSQWSPFEVKLAMALLRRHFDSTAQKVGYADSAEPIIQDLLARTPAVIAEVHESLPAGFSTRVGETIPGGLE